MYSRIEKKLFGRADISRSWVDPGHRTGTAGNAASRSSRSMTKATTS